MLGISNGKVKKIRYVFVLELACYRVCYIPDNVKYLYCIKSYSETCLCIISYTMRTKENKDTIQYIIKKSAAMLLEKIHFSPFVLFQISAGDYPFLRKKYI